MKTQYMDEESLLTTAETICLNAYLMKILKGFLKVLLGTFKKERALVKKLIWNIVYVFIKLIDVKIE